MNIKIIERILHLVWLVFIFIGLSGCASTSVFMSYPAQMSLTKQDINTSQYANAQQTLAKHRDSADKILYMMERGRVSFLAQDFGSSVKDFDIVIEAMEANEEKAKITARGVLGQSASLLSNENAIPYAGEGYERVFVHHYQALNYLFKNNLEAAGVEVRRANIEQQLALRKYEEEVDQALEGQREKSILESNKSYIEKYEAMSKVAASVKNSFQNAYTFYVSGLIYEARGEFNNALIDYKKALEIYPDNKYLIAEVARLAKRLNFVDDYNKVKTKAIPNLANELNENEGKVVILYEYGYVPQKQEVQIPFSFDFQLQNLTLPTYMGGQGASPKLSVSNNGRNMAKTEPIVNVAALAAKALHEKIPTNVVRQLSRMVLRQKAKTSMDDSLLGAVVNIGHFLLNRADLRSWLTLPSVAQIAHLPVKAGKQELVLSVAGKQETVPVSIRSGRTSIIYVHYVDNRFTTTVVNI